jgi:predicted secreted hydrolase
MRRDRPTGDPPLRRRAAALAILAVVALLLAGCSGGPVLANAPVVRPSPLATPAATPLPADPQPISLPRDDGPHGRLTEWWYYTGHLRDVASGRRYGFEFVVFRAERGDFPVSWASHLAITDQSGDRFVYAQRSEVGPQVDGSPRGANGEPTGFALTVDPAPSSGTAATPGAAGAAAPGASGASSAGGAPGDSPGAAAPGTGGAPGDSPVAPGASVPAGVTPGSPWSMAGSDGRDRLTASMTPAEAVTSGGVAPVTRSTGLDLALSATRPPVLHDGDGWIDFGPAGGSYYYSRTRMAASGELTVDGRTMRVDGIAWFDHQWGDFVSIGGGGWDWFAVNVADGTDVTVSLVRDASGAYPLAYGTLVRPDGTSRHLPAGSFTVDVTSHWTSPRTGATYPAGWTISIPDEALTIALSPTVSAQELDTRATTGVVYWEGSQRVAANRDGRPLGGEAYVELTGYAPAVLGSPAPSAVSSIAP